MCFATQLFWFAFHSISNFWGRVGGYIQTDSICHQATPLRCTSLKSRIPRHWRYQKGVSTIIETRGSWLLLQKKPGKMVKISVAMVTAVFERVCCVESWFCQIPSSDYCECGIESELFHQKKWVLFLPYNHESGNWPKFERELLVIIGLASPLLLRL